MTKLVFDHTTHRLLFCTLCAKECHSHFIGHHITSVNVSTNMLTCFPFVEYLPMCTCAHTHIHTHTPLCNKVAVALEFYKMTYNRGKQLHVIVKNFADIHQ